MAASLVRRVLANGRDLTASGGRRDRKTIDFPLKSRRKASILYPFSTRAAETVLGRFYHPKSGKCVAWATRIDNEGQTVCACQHGVPTVLAWTHETKLFVKPCGWRGTH